MINCSACGYNNCREMAQAIGHGYNRKENCIHYVKDELALEKQEMVELVEQLKNRDKKEQLYKEFLNNFETLSKTITELSQGNASTSNETMEMAMALSELSQYSRNLEESLNAFNLFISAYEKSNREIVDISSQASTFVKSLEELNTRTQQIAAGAEEIASQTELLEQVADTLVTQMEEVVNA